MRVSQPRCCAYDDINQVTTLSQSTFQEHLLHDARFSNHQGRFLGPCPHEGSFCTRGSPRFVPILPSGGRVAPSVLFPLPAAGSPRSLEFTLGFTLGPAVHGDFSLAGNLAVDTILVANAHHSCVRRLGVRKDGAVVVILEDDCARTAHVCHILPIVSDGASPGIGSFRLDGVVCEGGQIPLEPTQLR